MYNDNKSNKLHVPLSKAFNLGSLKTKEGIVSGTGSIFLLRIITATNTIIETVITNLNTNLSFIACYLLIKKLNLNF